MRINADLIKRRVNFIFGAIIINHIISSIDSNYLQRIKTKSSISINPSFNALEIEFELRINS